MKLDKDYNTKKVYKEINQSCEMILIHLVYLVYCSLIVTVTEYMKEYIAEYLQNIKRPFYKYSKKVLMKFENKMLSFQEIKSD